MGQIRNGLGFHKAGEWGWGFVRLGGGTGGLWVRSGMGLGFR